MLIVAVICLVAIALASFRYVSKQEHRFIDRLEETPLSSFVFLNPEGDTLRFEPGQTTVILFWATWSGRSLGSLYDLYNWHDSYPQFRVISAYVKDAPEFAKAHDRPYKDRFVLVDGTQAYQDLRVPGVPTAIVLDEEGAVRSTDVGTQTVPVWHELSTREQLQTGGGD